MVEQLTAVGLGFIVLAWIVQACHAFSTKKGKPVGLHNFCILFYAMGALILGLDGYLQNSPVLIAGNLLSALFSSVAFYIMRSK